MRYIDADKLITFANNHKDKMIDANDIARFPRADVVPKSEVEKAKQEVAREIIEGIEKIIDNEYNKHIFGNNDLDDLEHDAIINYSDDISSDLEELKKKYTESEGKL